MKGKGTPNLLSIKDLTLRIDYVFPQYIVDLVLVLHSDLRMHMCCGGTICINGKRLCRIKATQLRPFVADPFAWGCTSEHVKATALEICLRIFRKQETALKLYPAFMDAYVKHWKGFHGSVTIDLTDFILDNFDRCNEHLFSHYYIDSSKKVQEVDIWYDPITRMYSSVVEDMKMQRPILDEVKRLISSRSSKEVLLR